MSTKQPIVKPCLTKDRYYVCYPDGSKVYTLLPVRSTPFADVIEYFADYLQGVDHQIQQIVGYAKV